MPENDGLRLARLEMQNEQTEKRLDKGDGAFEKITAMIDELEEKVFAKFDEIQKELSELKWLKSPWVVGLIATALIFTGVGLTLSFIVGVDVTEQLIRIKEVVK